MSYDFRKNIRTEENKGKIVKLTLVSECIKDNRLHLNMFFLLR
jgi:hypothetical protein